VAHSYTNFNDAFTAYTELWDLGRVNWGYYCTSISNAISYFNGGNDHLALQQLLYAGYYGKYLFQYMMDYYALIADDCSLLESLYWARNDSLPSTPTMLQIINAMISSNPDELETFICIEDAFRASLWDKPFNYEWYAGMVRAFKSWR
jgi:hypothetical protein